MTRPSPQTDRVVALIETLRAHPERPLTVAAVTRRLGVNRSTCHAMLVSLTGAGWLLRDPTTKAYRLGPALIAVGQVAGSGLPEVEFAQGVMEALSDRLRLHCAALAVADDVYTVVRRVNHPLAPAARQRVGAAYPLRLPFGVAAVAWRDRAGIAAWLSTVPSGERRDRYAGVLDQARDRGYSVLLGPAGGEDLRDLMHAISEGDFPPGEHEVSTRSALERVATSMAEGEDLSGRELVADTGYTVVAVQAPVFDRDGHVALVLSLTGFRPATPGAEVVRAGELLAEAGQVITRAVGGPVDGARSVVG